MIVKSTLHNHCTLCDGSSTPDEMITAAIKAGFTDFGMSCHGYTLFDLAYSIESERSYLDTMASLREKYASRIRVWCGVEQEFYAPVETPGAYDYIIGSCHYVLDRESGKHIPVDGSCEDFVFLRDGVFGGDILKAAAVYYSSVAEIAEKQRPDILGHFDIFSRNNKDGLFFDEDSKEYKKIALDALDRCAETGVIIEVNAGAIARGHRDVPYPAPFLLRRMLELSVPVTLTSDCHLAKDLTSGIYEAAEILKSIGYKTVLAWENGAFAERPLD